MNQRSAAVAQLVLAGFLWSLGGILLKHVDMPPMAITSARSAVSAAVLLVYLKFRPRFTFSKPQIIGAFCYVGTVSLFVAANKNTTAANAILLQYGAPVYTAFLAYFILGEKLHKRDILAIIGIIIGILIFFAGDLSGGQALGNILAVLSGMTFAGLSVSMRMQKSGSPMETVLLGNILAFFTGLPFLLSAPAVLPYMAPLLTLGVFQLGIPYILYALAAKNVTALDLILIPMIEPILNPVWVFFGTGENPGAYSIIGGVFVICVVSLRSYWMTREGKKD